MAEAQFLAAFFMPDMLPQLLWLCLENYRSWNTVSGAICRTRLHGSPSVLLPLKIISPCCK
jgi:hypothetical protein